MNSRKNFVRGRFFDVNGILINPTGFGTLSGVNIEQLLWHQKRIQKTFLLLFFIPDRHLLQQYPKRINTFVVESEPDQIGTGWQIRCIEYSHVGIYIS